MIGTILVEDFPRSIVNIFLLIQVQLVFFEKKRFFIYIKNNTTTYMVVMSLISMCLDPHLNKGEVGAVKPV